MIPCDWREHSIAKETSEIWRQTTKVPSNAGVDVRSCSTLPATEDTRFGSKARS